MTNLEKEIRKHIEKREFIREYLIECLNDKEQKIHPNSEIIEFCKKMVDVLEKDEIYEKLNH